VKTAGIMRKEAANVVCEKEKKDRRR